VRCVCQAAALRVMGDVGAVRVSFVWNCRKDTLGHILTVQVLCKFLYLSDYMFGFFWTNS